MTQSPRLTLTATLMLLALAAVWGGSFFFAEVALEEVPPLTVTFHRVSWACPILLAIVLVLRIPLPRDPRIWFAFLVMGALNNSIPFSLIFWGQTQIESGLASILNGTTALFGAVVAGVLLKDEPLTLNKLIGAGLGLLGVAVIIGPKALTELSPTNLGQGAVVLAALSYAFASVWAKTQLSTQPPLVNAFGMVAGSSLLMLPIVLIVDCPPTYALSTVTTASLFGLAALSTVLAYVLYFAILPRAGAANLMLVTLLIPPFAILLGAAFLDERLTPTAWVGFACIAVGLCVTDGRLPALFASRLNRG